MPRLGLKVPHAGAGRGAVGDGQLLQKPRTCFPKYEQNHSVSFSIFKYLLLSQEAGNSYHHGGSTEFSRTNGEDERCSENMLDPDGIQQPLVRWLFIIARARHRFGVEIAGGFGGVNGNSAPCNQRKVLVPQPRLRRGCVFLKRCFGLS